MNRAVGYTLMGVGLLLLLSPFFITSASGGPPPIQCGTTPANPCPKTTTTSTATASGSSTTSTSSTVTSVVFSNVSGVQTATVTITSTTQTTSTGSSSSPSAPPTPLTTVTIHVTWDGKSIQGAIVSLSPSWVCPGGSGITWITCPSISPTNPSGTTDSSGAYSFSVMSASAGSFEGFYGSGSCCQPTGAQAGYAGTVTVNGATTKFSVVVLNGDGTLNPNPSVTLEADPSFCSGGYACQPSETRFAVVNIGGYPVATGSLQLLGLIFLAAGIFAVAKGKGGTEA